MLKHDVILTSPLRDVADARAPMRRSSPMGYAVTTMQRSPIPSSASFLQTIWRLMSERGGWVHRIQEKAFRVSSKSKERDAFAELKTTLARMMYAGLGILFLAGLSGHCFVNGLVYLAVAIGVVGIYIRLVLAVLRWFGTSMRRSWRDAWHLDDVIVCGFEKPVTREMSVFANAAAARCQCVIDREAREQFGLLREQAGLIALTLSPRISPIPTQARGA